MISWSLPSSPWEDSQSERCTTIDGRQIGYCSQKAVRQCTLKHQVENCAYCPEFDCTTISNFLDMTPKAKTNLDAIHESLK